MLIDKAKRFSLEFLAIFAGVTLGLLAEDWRQSRINAEDAREALALIADDLYADSTWMASSRGALEGHVRSAAWLQEHWRDTRIDLDSLNEALWGFLYVDAPQFRRVAYTSLQDGDRLALIEDDSLRLDILDYYEYWQAEARFYAEGDYRQRLKWYDDIITKHALAPPGRRSGTVWPPSLEPIRVTSTWQEIRADNLVYNQATAVGMWANLVLIVFDSAQARIGDLRGRIVEVLK